LAYLGKEHYILETEGKHIEVDWNGVIIVHFRGVWQELLHGEKRDLSAGVALCGNPYGLFEGKETDKKVDCPKCIHVLRFCKKINMRDTKLNKELSVKDWPRSD